MILITSLVNFFYISLSFYFILFSFHKIKKKKKLLQDCFVLPIFAAGLHVPVGLN